MNCLQWDRIKGQKEHKADQVSRSHICLSTSMIFAWDGKGAARVGEGEEGGLVGGAEPGDPSLAGGAVLPMKLRVYRLGICLLVSVQLLL